ncbi:hypothetical protein H4219_001017 [Mycoemilia scoparia]|uniref:N-acetyltransferase ESCO zinc-finger domain-containing protein n=1 Tax=Mycoemilia scoparia TaxID=417184 RepID=A0A9W8A7U6_9FUNG|nr:hypothetical protein H4219_001017 [Mycoemilia scoparia]
MSSSLNVTNSSLWTIKRRGQVVGYGKGKADKRSTNSNVGTIESPRKRLRAITPELSSDISGCPSSDNVYHAYSDDSDSSDTDGKHQQPGEPITPKKRRLSPTSIIDIFGNSVTPKHSRDGGAKKRMPKDIKSAISRSNNIENGSCLKEQTLLTMPSTQFTKRNQRINQKWQTKLEQTFLDFGQKTLEPHTCPDCKMTFQIGKDDDEAFHKTYHKAYIQNKQTEQGSGIPKLVLTSWKDTDQVAQLSINIDHPNTKNSSETTRQKQQTESLSTPFIMQTRLFSSQRIGNGSNSIEGKLTVSPQAFRSVDKQTNNTKGAISPPSTSYLVVAVSQQSSKSLKRRALEILNKINDQLGAAHLSMDELEQDKSNTQTQQSEHRKIYFLVSPADRVVEGCVLAERIKYGYRRVLASLPQPQPQQSSTSLELSIFDCKANKADNDGLDSNNSNIQIW